MLRYDGVPQMSDVSRREWLSNCLVLPLQPAVIAALTHAHAAAKSASRQFEFFDEPTVADVEALAEQIIPGADGPGAKEAGVVIFIDRALTTFAADSAAEFRAGLAQTGETRKKLFPSSTSIASLNPDEQMQLMQAIAGNEFFDLLRTLTVLGFLGEPSYGGNRNEIGWKQIGFEPRMSYQHPFGFYDTGAPDEVQAK